MTATRHDHDTLASCCTVPEETAEPGVLDEIEQQEVSPEVAALRSSGFRLLLETGEPVTKERWAEGAGVPSDTLDEVLASARARGRVELDAEDRLVGLAGLTVEPNRHRVDIDGEERWTGCALDAVGILGALEADGAVHSTDPHTGEPIKIGFFLGGFEGANVVEEWCPLVNFFTTREDAEAWVAEAGVDGEIVSLAAIASRAAEMWRPMVDLDAPQAC
jgi:alkylmercury lyase